MSIKHLERSEVLNLVYTQQADRMADAYASLKAEVERLTAFTTRTIIPNEELQAQVEELQNRCDFLEGRNSQ